MQMAQPDQLGSQLDFSFDEPKAAARRIWPVSELVSEMRGLVERRYTDVWVEGEISNFRPAPSGHIYFTLKDAGAQLPVVLFRRQAVLLKFRPEDGLHVLVRGQVSVYEQRGQMQLVAETMEPVGAGSLQLAFEQLKERLKLEGLFDTARKRPLPAFPRCVGIITSPTGAVIRDFLNIVGRRHSALNVLLYPVSVQGDSSPAEIEIALRDLNASSGLVDLIVVARGGGSLEDLAAFNSERVARAIAASGLPVVSAVGHETDFTIADFVSDLRAPTPSAAAELVTEAQHRVAERVANQSLRLDRAMRFQVLHARQLFARVQIDRSEGRMNAALRRLEQRSDELTLRGETAIRIGIRALCDRVARLELAVLRHDPRRRLAHAAGHVADFRSRMERAVERVIDSHQSRLSSLDARLHSLSPLAVLDRGYALVLSEYGTVVRSSAELTSGQRVATRLAHGAFTSRVEGIESKTAQSASSRKKLKIDQ